jgi:hypothetical protein
MRRHEARFRPDHRGVVRRRVCRYLPAIRALAPRPHASSPQ